MPITHTVGPAGLEGPQDSVGTDGSMVPGAGGVGLELRRCRTGRGHWRTDKVSARLWCRPTVLALRWVINDVRREFRRRRRLSGAFAVAARRSRQSRSAARTGCPTLSGSRLPTRPIERPVMPSWR